MLTRVPQNSVFLECKIMQFLKRILSNVMRPGRLVITDPAYVLSKSILHDDIEVAESKGMVVAVSTDECLLHDIDNHHYSEVPWLHDEEHVSFGVIGHKGAYISMGQMTSDSGMICIIREDCIDRDLLGNWGEFVTMCLKQGADVHHSKQYPTFLWYGSCMDGDNTTSVFGVTTSSHSGVVLSGLLLRSAEHVSQGE